MENKDVYLPYKILKRAGNGEIIEKKSRFIATLSPVYTEEEAVEFIEAVKKRYFDARHNCSAFAVGDKTQVTRCSDDGEPAGTAGRPMLEVLKKSEIRNAAVVVTRYFGGILLGTGGLIRAYTQAVQAGILASQVTYMRYGVEIKIETDYTDLGKIQYIMGQAGLHIKGSQYAENVILEVVVPYEKAEQIQQELTEITAGKIKMKEIAKYYYMDG